MQSVNAKPLTPDSFARFGRVIARPSHRDGYIETKYVRFWSDVADLGQASAVHFLNVKQVPLICEALEALPRSVEAYVSLDGKPSVIVVAPSDERGKPDLGQLAAFRIEGGVSPVIGAGIWHWNPLPLAEEAEFAVVIRGEAIIREGGVCQVNPAEVFVETFEPVAIAVE